MGCSNIIRRKNETEKEMRILAQYWEKVDLKKQITEKIWQVQRLQQDAKRVYLHRKSLLCGLCKPVPSSHPMVLDSFPLYINFFTLLYAARPFTFRNSFTLKSCHKRMNTIQGIRKTVEAIVKYHWASAYA
jgi:hypothetical protein